MTGRRIGVISGSGSYQLNVLYDRETRTITTAYGSVETTLGRLAGVDVAQVARHGATHQRLSNQVDHRANLAALFDCGVAALVSLSVCGSTDPAVAPGSIVVFDDLYFPSNRLPDGSLCTWHTEPGEKSRGHWIFDTPFSEPLRAVLVQAARQLDVPVVERGCYGHVDGPRFNTRTEITALTQAGVTAISQTAGPDVVLAGEAEVPLALVGFVTDYANGVGGEPEPVEALQVRMKQSTDVFARLLEQALPTIAGVVAPPGFVYRFES